jgi:S1-C subfamily serine protease
MLVAMGSISALMGQQVPLQKPEEKQVTRQQSEALFDAIRPVARAASPSTVWVWADRKPVAMGTVIGDGNQVLTKWSQIAFARTPVQVVGGDRTTGTARVVGVYQDDDLALLEIVDADFDPVSFSTEVKPTLGQFLIAAGPGDQPLKAGVVAVAERPLRESDQAFLGVMLDPEFEGPGVRVQTIDDRGGADEAGLQGGDVLLAVDGQAVTSAFELRGILQKTRPGESIRVKYLREGAETETEILLGGRPEFQRVPEARLRSMRSMGTDVSLVAGGFPVILQSDMQLTPEQCGGPVVDLQGRVIGISIARPDRTRSFIIPSSRIVALLEEEPLDPGLAALPREAEGRGVRPAAGQQGMPIPPVVPLNRGSAERLRKHLEEMSDLLERMEREMEPLER